MLSGPTPPGTNWAGNVTFQATGVHTPRSVEELQLLVTRGDPLRAVGSRHSFTRIADTTGHQVSMTALPRVLEVDSATRSVRVSAGLRYGDLAGALSQAGLALPNLGSLPHISVAGSCATGTHGSGMRNPVLSAGVGSLTMVTAGGDLLRVDRESHGEDYAGFVIALGRLGIVTELVLDLVPAFEVAQTVVDDVAEEVAVEQLPAILAAAYSVSIFTDWRSERVQVWVKEQLGRADGWSGRPLWGGRPADGPRHPIAGMPIQNATTQLGIPGPWSERLPHFRLDFTPSSGKELQSEYVVPMTRAAEAWRALGVVRERIARVLQVSEVRAIAADDLWLSPTGGSPSVAFHFTWIPDTEAVLPVVAAVEQQLAPLGARPHWGKVFSTPPSALADLYPRMDDFRRLVTTLDPTGVFGNELVDTWIGLR